MIVLMDNVILGENDLKMMEAYKNAQETFKYFWRELSWEERRIIPALDFAYLKIGFKSNKKECPTYEHMWVSDFVFNGNNISGILMNQPRWVSLKEGDKIIAEFNDISDWIFSVDGKVYGGYTVNLLRTRMSKSEIKQHDDAWGLDFGDPNEIEIFIKPKVGKKDSISDEILKKQEHPMCINMENSLKKQLSESDNLIKFVDEFGNSMLHSDSLSGNGIFVKILLEHGANPNLKNNFGQTALDLAVLMKWDHVIDILT